MAGYRASGGGFYNLLKPGVFPKQFLYQLDGGPGTHGMGNKNPAEIDIPLMAQAILNITLETALKTAPVFFADLHPAIDYLDAGFYLQHSGTEHFQAGTTPAPMQVIQTVNDKAGVHFGDQFLQTAADIPRLCSVLGQTGRLIDDMAASGGEVARVDHMDIRIIHRRQNGVLIAGRKARADADMDHGLISRRKALKKAFIFIGVDGGGLAGFLLDLDIPEDIRRRDVHPVPERFVIDQNVKGHQRDIHAAQNSGGKITSAVRSYFDHFPTSSLLCVSPQMRSAVTAHLSAVLTHLALRVCTSSG